MISYTWYSHQNVAPTSPNSSCASCTAAATVGSCDAVKPGERRSSLPRRVSRASRTLSFSIPSRPGSLFSARLDNAACVGWGVYVCVCDVQCVCIMMTHYNDMIGKPFVCIYIQPTDISHECPPRHVHPTFSAHLQCLYSTLYILQLCHCLLLHHRTSGKCGVVKHLFLLFFHLYNHSGGGGRGWGLRHKGAHLLR